MSRFKFFALVICGAAVIGFGGATIAALLKSMPDAAAELGMVFSGSVLAFGLSWRFIP